MALSANEIRVIVRSEVRQAQQGLGNMQRSIGQTERSAMSMAAGFAAAGVAIAGVVREARASLNAWSELEAAQNRVAAAAEINGENLDLVLPQYQELAAEIERVTVVSDDAALEMIALAQSMGVSSREMDQVVRGAVGLSRTFGIGQQQAIQAVTNALDGNFTQLQRYVPAIQNADTEAEKMAATQRAMADGFEIASREVDTLAGRTAQYQNAISGLREQAGRFIAGEAQGLLSFATNLASDLAEGVQHFNHLRDAQAAAARGNEDLQDRITLAREEVRLIERRAERELMRQGFVREGTQQDLDAAQALLRRREIALDMAQREAEQTRETSDRDERAAQARARRQEELAEQMETVFRDQEDAGERLRDLDLERLEPKERELELLRSEREEVQQRINQIRDLNASMAELGMDEEIRFGALAGLRDRLNEQIARAEEELNAESEAIRENSDRRDEIVARIEAERAARREALQERLRENQQQMEQDQALRDQFVSLTEDRITAIRRQRDAFIDAGVDEVEAARWASQEMAQEYMSAANQIWGAFSQLWSTFNQQSAENTRQEIRRINDEVSALEDRHEKERELARATGATSEELAQMKVEQLEREEEAKEQAAEREAELELRQFRREQAQRIAEATMAAFTAATQALPNIPLSVTVGALGLANVAKIAAQSAPSFERGGSFVTNGEQLIRVGDGQSRRERVTVEPLSGPYARAGEGNTVVHVHISGVVGDREAVSAWVEEGIRRGRERGKIRRGSS